MTGLALSIDRDRCIGSGMCLLYAPGTFDHDDEVKAVLQDPTTDDIQTVQLAVEACPTRALRLLTNDEGA